MARKARAARTSPTASERRFRALIEKSAGGVSLFTRAAKNIYFSPNTPRLFGRTPEEILDHSPFEYAHPEDVPHCLRELAELIQQPGTSVTRRFRYCHKDGALRWIEVTATNLLDEPGVEAVAANYRDITDAVEAKAALRASELRFRTLATTASAAVVLYDGDDRITYANPAAVAISGYSQDELLAEGALQRSEQRFSMNRYLDANQRGLELLGYTREELLQMTVADVLVPRERPRLAIEPAEMLAGKPHLADWELLRKDGSTFPAEVSARKINDETYLAIVLRTPHPEDAELGLRRGIALQFHDRNAEL